jgi:uncharacterized protein YjiK
MKIRILLAAIVAATSLSAQAASSIHLGNYQVVGTYGLDILNGTSGGISGLEASAVTYARDRGTLFYVGDEGTGVIEISLTGQTLGYNVFDWSGTGSTKHDTEGLTYLGNGVLVVGEERLQDAYRFTYNNASGSSISLKDNFVSISDAKVGNNGMEGISYDPRGTGSFVTVKQQSPQGVLAGSLTFGPATGLPPSTSGDGSSPAGGGVSTVVSLFDPVSMGLSTLSDVQTLSPVDSFAGTPAADNLLVLSLGSRMLVEVNRSGQVLSSLDLSNILPHNGIEGVTVDEKGTIYLVAEQIQDGFNAGLDPNPRSQLIVLAAPVPEPETFAMLLSGLGVLAAVAARRRKRAQV